MKKLIYLFIILLTLFYSNVTYTQNTDVKEYYSEICGNTEWGGSIKPAKYKKNIKIFVAGNKSSELLVELEDIVDELNQLITTIDIIITEDKTDYNLLLYFGSPFTYMDFIKDYSDSERLKNNWGLFAFYRSSYDRSEIISSEVFVNTIETKNTTQQKHLLREELTQSIGFPNDSYRYKNSIFQQKWTEVTKYSELDKKIIKMHYTL